MGSALIEVGFHHGDYWVSVASLSQTRRCSRRFRFHFDEAFSVPVVLRLFLVLVRRWPGLNDAQLPVNSQS